MTELTKILTVVALLLSFEAFSAPSGPISFNVSDPSETMPTRCLASGRSCVGEQSISNGLIINPSALASPVERTGSAWHLNIGNISQSLRIRTQEKITIKSNDGAVGWATGWGASGIGILASVKNTDSSYSGYDTETSSEKAKSHSSFGSIAIRGGIRVSKNIALGISYARYGLMQDFSLDTRTSETRLPKLENSFFGNAPTFGALFGNPKSTSVGIVYRPQVEFSDSGDNLKTNGDAQRGDGQSIRTARQAYQQISTNGFQTARMLMPAKTTLGLETVLLDQRRLVFRSDISLLSPTIGAYRMDSNYLLYLSQESDLLESSRQYKILPGGGFTAALPSLLFFNEAAAGAYYDESRAESFVGDRHFTYGLRKNYSILGLDFSCDFAVDQTQFGRRFVISLF